MLQEQQIALECDDSLPSRCELVGPRIPRQGVWAQLGSSSADHVRDGVVILAYALQKVSVRHQRLVHFQRKRPCKRFRIVDSHFQVHVSEIAAAEAFGNVKGFGVRMPFYIEPASVIETRSIDHQRFSLPVPNRVPHPSWTRVLRKLTAVGKDRSMNTIGR